MVQRVATDERPFETPSSDESGMGRSDSPSEESQPEAALVSITYNKELLALENNLKPSVAGHVTIISTIRF